MLCGGLYDIQDVNFGSENGSNSMTGHELVAIFDFLDHHYNEMFGHNKGTEYAKDKAKRWAELVKIVSRANQGKFMRTEDVIRTKMYNLIYQGTFCFCITIICKVFRSKSSLDVKTFESLSRDKLSKVSQRL